MSKTLGIVILKCRYSFIRGLANWISALEGNAISIAIWPNSCNNVMALQGITPATCRAQWDIKIFFYIFFVVLVLCHWTFICFGFMAVTQHVCCAIRLVRCHGPLARYVELWVAHAPGMPGTFSSPRVSDPDKHAGIANYRFSLKSVAWKTFRHSRGMRNPHFFASGKKSIAVWVWWLLIYIKICATIMMRQTGWHVLAGANLLNTHIHKRFPLKN